MITIRIKGRQGRVAVAEGDRVDWQDPRKVKTYDVCALNPEQGIIGLLLVNAEGQGVGRRTRWVSARATSFIAHRPVAAHG